MSYLDEKELAGHARAWKDKLKEGRFYSTKEIAKTFAECHNEGIKEMQLLYILGIIEMQGPTERKNTDG